MTTVLFWFSPGRYADDFKESKWFLRGIGTRVLKIKELIS